MKSKQINKYMRIKKDMTIGELVVAYPSSVEILLDAGVHCVGCGAANFETLEQGLAGHGMTEEEVDSVIKKLNDAIPENKGDAEQLQVTDKAISKVKEIWKSQKKEGVGIRIDVEECGCASYKYNLSFEKKASKDDEVIEVEGVKFYIQKENFEKLKGATVDYVDTLQGAGFKVNNPNTKSICNCGTSFS